VLECVHRRVCWSVVIGQSVGVCSYESVLEGVHRRVCSTVFIGECVGLCS
jgi:hypothetical protein